MKLRISFLLLAVVLAPAVAVAATLETVVNALASPVGAPMDAVVPSAKWATIAKFPGVKWRDRDLQEPGGKGKFTRSGSVALTGLGSTPIIWAGSPDFADEANLRTGTRLTPDQYLGMLKSQFSPATKVRTVRAGWKVNPTYAEFEVTLPGKQSAYLHIHTTPNWNDGKTTISVWLVDVSGAKGC